MNISIGFQGNGRNAKIICSRKLATLLIVHNHSRVIPLLSFLLLHCNPLKKETLYFFYGVVYYI